MLYMSRADVATKCSRVCDDDDDDDKRFDNAPLPLALPLPLPLPLIAPSEAPLGGNFLAAKASRRVDAVDALLLLPARLVVVVVNEFLRSPFEDVEEPFERRDD